MTVEAAEAPHTLERVEEAAAVVRTRFDRTPDAAIILGTGLGALADEIDVEATLDYADLPGFVRSTVESHAGRLLCGTFAGRSVVVMQGRFHRYEGHSLRQVTFPVR
ncbi:MAG TPA: purine-nucleoside phosphorylase, partial [Gemmatimonadaceae bacterium]|nr:purine-nucleoside phosphorylase [Gemmatimonadaceae bacterium]